MSDEEAKKKEQEQEEVKKKSEALQKRLWIVELVRDPEGEAAGATTIIPRQNVGLQWQLDMMLDQAKKKNDLTNLSRNIVLLLTNMSVIKPKGKGLFGRK